MRVLPLFFAALTLFGQTPHERAWKVLDQGLGDTNPLKRKQAVLAIGLLQSDPKAVTLAEAALTDKDVNVRGAACDTLAQVKSRSSIPKLQTALDDNAPEVIFAAARALYQLGDPMGQQTLSAILLGDQPDSSSFMTKSVRELKHKMHSPKAMLELGVKAGAGIAVPGGGLGVAGAEGILGDSQASGKTIAALLLATDHSPDSFMALNAGLTDKNWTVRAASAQALGLRGFKGVGASSAAAVMDGVQALLDDKQYQVQYAAAATLIRLK
jgi:HEAT repeat protein